MGNNFMQMTATAGQLSSALQLLMRSSKTGRKTLSVALAVWDVAPSFWNQMLPISSSSIFTNINSLNIHCNVLSVLICEEKWLNYVSKPKSAQNSDSFWVRRLFNVCVRVFFGPNATILIVYISAKLKMSFIWKDDFLPKSATSVIRLQANLAKRIHNAIRSTEG